MNFSKKEKKNLIKFKFVVDFMNNLLNLLKELDNHNCKTEETIMLMFKVVEKYNFEIIMIHLLDNPGENEYQIQRWMRSLIYRKNKKKSDNV